MAPTQKQWREIDSMIQYYIDRGITPNLYQLRDISDKFTEYNSRPVIDYRNRNTTGKKLMWYSVTFTYPDKDFSRLQKSIDKLKKYSKYKDIYGRFEIGEGGLYHVHFLVKTYAYLRAVHLRRCNAGKNIHVQKLAGQQGHAYQNYINKDVGKESDQKWVMIANFDCLESHSSLDDSQFQMDDIQPGIVTI